MTFTIKINLQWLSPWTLRAQYFWNEISHWGMDIQAPMYDLYLIKKTDLIRRMSHDFQN